MVRIAVDVMGGDHAPEAIVIGAIEAAKIEKNLELVLFGHEKIIKKIIEQQDYPADRITIKNCSQVITGDDQPVMAVRRKQDSSLVKAIKSVTEGETDGILSAGNTGALMVGSILHIGRIPGIERPALSAIFPVLNGGSMTVLDIGANMDPKPQHLLDYARMGRLFSAWVIGVDSPRVGLLNVGTEANKGNELMKKSFKLLQVNEPGFIGNTETRNLLQGITDVLVCDGFTGNVMLKTVEGVAISLFSTLKTKISSGGIRAKLGGAVLLPTLMDAKNQFDQETYGGAPLLGISAAVIKAHGSSTHRGIKNSLLNQAYPFVFNKLLDRITQEIQE